ncbi:hypothetical protein [Nocardia sp. CS682]|uniref:hypothetical protein n=1 Tax=Nocardia sp. CS682 TaxID=1047172 RepID=UPI001074EB0F|nr:hypothetical protein [Nocardia sp. CS682]
MTKMGAGDCERPGHQSYGTALDAMLSMLHGLMSTAGSFPDSRYSALSDVLSRSDFGVPGHHGVAASLSAHSGMCGHARWVGGAVVESLDAW